MKNDAEDQGWTLRVAKVICLLEFVRDLPRTEANIAAFLVDEVGKPSPTAQVQAAIKKLQAAQFIRNTDEGWKLQTLLEKKWETERGTYLEPKQRERNEIARQVLREVFGVKRFSGVRWGADMLYPWDTYEGTILPRIRATGQARPPAD